MATGTSPPAVPPSDGDQDPLDESGGERHQPPRAAATAGMTEEDRVAFRRFQRFLRLDQQGPSPSPLRGRRGRDEDEDDDGHGEKGQSGPPPSWDGSTPFEDFLIRARLWLATTKARGKARGPLLLKALSGTPFETFKHLAKDNAWLNDSSNADNCWRLWTGQSTMEMTNKSTCSQLSPGSPTT